MAEENLTREQRSEIARTFKVEPDMEELLGKIEKDKTVFDKLNSTHKISLALYKRSKTIAQEFNKGRK